jgi:low affinity Fe/Cu permease
MKSKFTSFATLMSHWFGTPWAFLIALAVVTCWFIGGFFVGFSSTLYQLLINTGTTIITFLMVFLIQNTQNRDAKAMHLKLDELVRATEAADNAIISAEDETDEEMEALKQKYEALCDEHAELKSRLESSDSGRAGSPVSIA